MKVLVVDDHPLVRGAIAHLVTRLDADMQVLEAADCVQGLALASEHADLGLVLLDLICRDYAGSPPCCGFAPTIPPYRSWSCPCSATARR